MQKDKKLLMKYYLRGVGTGLATAVLLLGLSGVNQKVDALKGQKEDPKVTERTNSGQSTESTEVASCSSHESSEGNETDETKETRESKASTDPSESTETQETSESITPGSESTDASASSETDATATSDGNTSTSEPPETKETTEGTNDSTETTATSNETDASTETDGTSESTEAGDQGGQTAQDGDYTLTIYRGYSSWTVAKILAQESIVEDAKAFDDYLCKNGYDKRIRVGSFVIPEGSDEATIAKIITGDM